MKQGVVTSHFGVAVEIEDANRERTMMRVKRKSGILVGDMVSFSDAINSIAPRKNVLARQTDFGIQQIAANLDALGIVVAPIPQTPLSFIDLAIVASRHQGIHPFLVINKSDLPEHNEFQRALIETFGAYMTVFSTSTATGAGIDALKKFLNASGRSLFTGVSGSGKSSLVNKLVPGTDLDIGILSTEDSHGKHMTTVSTLHHLDGGGELIDTPGIRDLRIASVPVEDLALLFSGFAQWLQTPCRFRNCLHDHEPGCHIREAVAKQKIAVSRYNIYLELLGESKRDAAKGK